MEMWLKELKLTIQYLLVNLQEKKLIMFKRSNRNLNLVERAEEVQVKERKKPKYTPLSKRQDRPDAALWLLKNYPEFTDGQISKLVGSTKGTVH